MGQKECNIHLQDTSTLAAQQECVLATAAVCCVILAIAKNGKVFVHEKIAVSLLNQHHLQGGTNVNHASANKIE